MYIMTVNGWRLLGGPMKPAPAVEIPRVSSAIALRSPVRIAPDTAICSEKDMFGLFDHRGMNDSTAVDNAQRGRLVTRARGYMRGEYPGVP